MDCLRKLETVLIKETLFLVHFAVSFQRIEYYRSRNKTHPQCLQNVENFAWDMLGT